MTFRVALPAKPGAMPDRALPVHSQLEGYAIESVIAQSDFAVVYRACDCGSGQVVAIKEYLPHVLALRHPQGRLTPRSPGCAERFERGRAAFADEARSLARFDHASLVRVLRLFHANGTVYRVMRFSPGPTLLEYRRALGQMPAPEDFARWFDGLLDALALLHRSGCVHGSVSPGNILLRPGERALLLDFDAVREALVGDRVPGTMPATKRCFMPTERLAPTAHRRLGSWTDLYSIAASLHYALCGRLPEVTAAEAGAGAFEPLAVYWRRACGDAPIPVDIARRLDAIEACLADDPQRRPQSVAELRSRLDAQGTPPSALAGIVGLRRSEGEAAQTCSLDAAASADAAAALEARADTPANPESEAGASTEVAADVVADADLDAPAGAAFDDLVGAARASPADDLDRSTFAAAIPPAPPIPALPEVLEPGVAMPSIAPMPALPEEPAAVDGAAASRAAAPLRVVAAVGLALAASLVVGAWWSSGRQVAPDPRSESTPALSVAPTDVATAAPVPPHLRYEPSGAGPTATVAAPVPVAAPTAVLPPAPGPALFPVPAAVAATVVSPRAVRPVPVKTKQPRPVPTAVATATPRMVCGDRAGFALYRCMQTQCARPAMSGNKECVQLRRSDAVD